MTQATDRMMAAPPVRRRLTARASGIRLMIWSPFIVIAVTLGVLADNLMLLGGAVVWAFSMAYLGAHIPSLVFAGFWQGSFAMTGCAYLGVYGRYPGGVANPDLVPLAVLAVFGSTLIVAIVFKLLTGKDRLTAKPPTELKLNQKQLFFLLLFMFSPEWLGITTLLSSTGGFRQFVAYTLLFRYVFFALYFLRFLRAKSLKNLPLFVFLVAYISLPASLTGGAGWAGTIMVMFLVYINHLIFGHGGARTRLKGGAVTAGLAGVLALTAFGLLWEGGLKASWRNTLAMSGTNQSVTEKLSAFIIDARYTVSTFQLEPTLDRLASRMSSGVGYSSLVYENVPAIVDHERGARALAAVQNMIPRILYPNKPNLGGDSWLVRKYANLRVAGDERGASIGLGYITEMYIDFGIPGIIGESALLGGLLALALVIFRRIAGNADLANIAFMTVAWQSYLYTDAALVKLVSGVVIQIAMFSILLFGTRRFFFARVRPRGAGPRRLPPGAVRLRPTV